MNYYCNYFPDLFENVAQVFIAQPSLFVRGVSSASHLVYFSNGIDQLTWVKHQPENAFVHWGEQKQLRSGL